MCSGSWKIIEKGTPEWEEMERTRCEINHRQWSLSPHRDERENPTRERNCRIDANTTSHEWKALGGIDSYCTKCQRYEIDGEFWGYHEKKWYPYALYAQLAVLGKIPTS